MSDSEKKKPCRPATQPRAAATKPCRPSAPAPQTAAAKPCRPAPTPAAPATRPCRPSAPAPVATATARPSSRPSAEPVRTPPSRIERRLEPPAPRPRAAPKPYASSAPKARGERAVGSFEALAGKAFPTFEERAAATGCVRVIAVAAKSGDTPIACVAPRYEEPRYYSGAEISFAVGPRPTNAQVQAYRRKGYRHSREIAQLGDAFGRRTVVCCEADGGIEEIEIQESVPTHWFMSPDIPAWKSRAVPTEGNGSATRRPASDRGEECFRAIFDGPSVELASRLYAKRWSRYYADHRGTEATAELLGERLWDEIVEEEFLRANRRLEYAFAIGEARFARLWNLAVATCTLAAKPADAAIDAPAIDASDVLPTS